MPTKICIVTAMVFLLVMYGCESWTIKEAKCQRIDAFELWCWRRLESPLDYKTKTVHPKANQYWIFIGRTDAEDEAPILWLPEVKNWLIGKDPDAGKDWRQEENGTTEDEMVEWHHWLNRHVSILDSWYYINVRFMVLQGAVFCKGLKQVIPSS